MVINNNEDDEKDKSEELKSNYSIFDCFNKPKEQ
jgi:hypothetical protein